MADFVNKVVIVTGASSGIGAGTAEFLAKQGAWLVLVGRNEENLKSVAAKCPPTHGAPQPLQIVADVTIEADAKRIIDTTIEKFQKLNVLVNNAGILKRGTIETSTLEDYDTVMNVNVRSIFHLTQLAVPHLIATKGNVVNVSSVNGMRSFPGVLAYNMSKAALDQLTQCVALELADRGIRVNSVNPGVIVTNIHKRDGMDEAAYAAFLEHSKSTHALGRAGNTIEVAESIAFLASERASFITGAILPVDGGRHSMCPR
ncbi:3-oxoacyl-[acyl-carrier-protein] reductase FabG-like [Sitodiplosis mosellana]|uniref:3-oxoacyl-[acyl-carrier-protein] reductase FabG-like n=1 Tax=Sitodiplosis mosellana TaxID=263140 RepID=UPI002443B162|nr:3-oxoacyl-[acyl-carrier-protein] reductase FabG-like [Sitodiplosis mosellana]